MKEVTFKVKGSSGKPYEVMFVKRSENLADYCDCQAGLHGLYCKHRIEILAGESKNIVSGSNEDHELVLSWFKGTELESVLKEITEVEITQHKIKNELKRLKKKLSRLMHQK
ncbi:MAG: hypothetical protein AB8D52_04590 [Gammaproteobacteria bacterium]